MRVILTRPRAADDLIELWDYIADDSVTRADAFIDDIDSKFHLLAEQPTLGRSRDELAPGLRSVPFGRYVIFYEVMPHGIAIVRVLHGARDLGPSFEGD